MSSTKPLPSSSRPLPAISPGFRPDVGGQIGVRVVDARVDDGNDGVLRARARVPGFRGIYVRVDSAAVLADVVHTPERSHRRIVGQRADGDDVVWLSERHARGMRQAADRFATVTFVFSESRNRPLPSDSACCVNAVMWARLSFHLTSTCVGSKAEASMASWLGSAIAGTSRASS